MGREKGRVTVNGETWFPIVLIGHTKVATEGLVDTGFDDLLSIPRALAVQLRLPIIGMEDYELADGHMVSCQTAALRIRFLARTRNVVAMLSDSEEVLLGTPLMRGHRLTIRYRRRSARLDPDR